MGVQHGFGTIRLPEGRVKKGRFENNQYIGKVEDESKQQRPKPLPKPELEVLHEDPGEEMQGSRLGMVQPIQYGQNLEVGELQIPTKQYYDMQAQTSPVAKRYKDKGL